MLILLSLFALFFHYDSALYLVKASYFSSRKSSSSFFFFFCFGPEGGGRLMKTIWGNYKLALALSAAAPIFMGVCSMHPYSPSLWVKSVKFCLVSLQTFIVASNDKILCFSSNFDALLMKEVELYPWDVFTYNFNNFHQKCFELFCTKHFW